MKFLLSLFILPLVHCFHQTDFHQFKLKYDKQYLNPTLEYKSKIIFNDNLSNIKYFNQRNQHLKLDMNQFGDLNLHLFYQQFLMKNQLLNENLSLHQYSFRSDFHFINIDWNQMGYVRPVKQQGKCGSCWSFSTIGALESFIDIHNGIKTELSEQELVDCSKKNHGCNGGWMHLAYQYILDNNGVLTSKEYPYLGKEKSCKNLKPQKMKETSQFKLGRVKMNDLTSLQYAIYLNPISIAIDANQFEFMFYKDGIYDKPLETNPQLNHAILLTAMNIEKEYWTIKNSWGLNWGIDGYMNIKIKPHLGVGGMNSYCVLPLSI